MTLKNNRAPLLCYFKLCASFPSHQWIQTGVTVRNPPIRLKISNFLSRATLKFDRWPWRNNRAPLLCYFKLCASFPSHLWIQTGVTVRKRPSWVKISDFFCLLWPWNLTDDLEKTIGHLFYATSSYVHHLVAICEFKLELWSGNAQIEAKFALTSVTLTFDFLHGHHFCPW